MSVMGFTEKDIKETFKRLKLDQQLTENSPDTGLFLLTEPGELVWFQTDNTTKRK